MEKLIGGLNFYEIEDDLKISFMVLKPFYEDLQEWYSLRFFSCENVYDIRHEVISCDLLQVEKDRSDGFLELMDGI